MQTADVVVRRSVAAARAGAGAFAATFRATWRGFGRDERAAAHASWVRARRELRVVASAASAVRLLIGRVGDLPDFTSGLGTTPPDRFGPRLLAVARRLQRAGAGGELHDAAVTAWAACEELDRRAREYTAAVLDGFRHYPAEVVLREASAWPSSRLWPRYPAAAHARLSTLAARLEARSAELRATLGASPWA